LDAAANTRKVAENLLTSSAELAARADIFRQEAGAIAAAVRSDADDRAVAPSESRLRADDPHPESLVAMRMQAISLKPLVDFRL